MSLMGRLLSWFLAGQGHCCGCPEVFNEPKLLNAAYGLNDREVQEANLARLWWLPDSGLLR